MDVHHLRRADLCWALTAFDPARYLTLRTVRCVLMPYSSTGTVCAARLRPQAGTVRRPASWLVSAIAAVAMASAFSSCASSRPRAVPTVKSSSLPSAVIGASNTTGANSALRPTAGRATGAAITITEGRSPRGEVVGIARIDLRRTRIDLLGGTLDPGQGSDGQVPIAQRPGLLAAFNGGFKLRQSQGGLFLRGRTYRPLVAGAATVVVHRDGTAAVGMWGRDVAMSSDVVAVRQNLTLLVDRSAPVPGLAAHNALFGATIGHRVAVSRSGLCNARDGTLVYVAGRDLSAADLAQVMVAAGCVRGMELDINPQYVVYIAYRHVGSNLVGTRLVPSMHYGPDRFLKPQSRDFFAVFSR